MRTIPNDQATPGAVLCDVCGGWHRLWRALARCRWRNALWIEGAGRFASVSLCHPGATVILHATREDAEAARKGIDKFACGGRCNKMHRVIDLLED